MPTPTPVEAPTPEPTRRDTAPPPFRTTVVARCDSDAQCLVPDRVETPSRYWPAWEDCLDTLVIVQRVADGACFVSSLCSFFERDPAWRHHAEADCTCSVSWPGCP
jgi:hypothetical protein